MVATYFFSFRFLVKSKLPQYLRTGSSVIPLRTSYVMATQGVLSESDKGGHDKIQGYYRIRHLGDTHSLHCI